MSNNETISINRAAERNEDRSKPEQGKVYSLAALAQTDNWAASEVGGAVETELAAKRDVRHMPAYCDPENVNTGSRHAATKELDIAEIAKRVRKELRAGWSGFTFSVKISRYSMGQSIDVRVKAVPSGFAIVTPERAYAEATHPHDVSEWPREQYSDGAAKLLEQVRDILASYNRTNIDSMSDYYDVRFSSSADFDWTLEREDKEAALLRWVG